MALSGTINGTCGGTSGTKYDFWLDWIINSQSITNNTSNVTATLKLKRNDGFAASAYNLTGSADATIVADSDTKASGSLNFDTRNSATAELKTATFNTTHEDDGSKTISFSSVFNSELSSVGQGTLSGSAVIDSIPRGIWNIGDGGNYEPHLVYVGIDGSYQQCISYIGDDGSWKQTI